MEKTWSKLCEEMAVRAIKKQIPFSATFELTSRCNLQCKMCYVCENMNNNEVQNKELSTQQWKMLAKEARDAGLFFATLTGGEVFLRKDFKELYTEFVNLGILVQIYTNGTMITKEIVDWLSTIPPYRMSITLYGASSDTYKKVTGQADGFERTIKAIDMLLEAGISLEVRTTVVKGNSNEMKKLSDIVNQRGLKLSIVNYISPRREGVNTDPIGNRLAPEELAQYEKDFRELNRQLREIDKEKIIKTTDAIDSDIIKVDEKSEEMVSNPNDAFFCNAAKSAYWMTWDGRMLGCGLLAEPIMYPLEIGLKNAWEGLKQERSRVLKCEECENCEYSGYCDRCPARLLMESGCTTKSASYLCDTAHKRFDILKDA